MKLQSSNNGLKSFNNKKIAIVYDRVNKFGGAERVLLVLHEMFPKAELYTSIHNKEKTLWADVFPKINTSFLQKIPFFKNHHELIGWLMPLSFESFNFNKYDLVISVTSEAAKGIITGTNTLHVCYCLTPTRYLWSGRKFYLNHPPRIFNIFPFYKILSWPFITYLRWWDKDASKRPDKIIAISNEVKRRIKKYYNIDTEVVFPPVSLSNSEKIKILSNKRKYYLIHGRFEPYKRLDLVIKAFKNQKNNLIVSGSGSEFNKYKNKQYKNIKFISNPTDKDLIKLYSNAKAFIMPQEEDFGITSVEAQSFGVPVIAYMAGGAIDTVIDGVTGIFFKHQSMESLKQAIAKFDTMSFNRKNIIKNANKFGSYRFKREFQRSLVRAIGSWRGRN